jgi:transcription-repair coupling factor (superfamily II helicase)
MNFDTFNTGSMGLGQKLEETAQFKRLLHIVEAPGAVVTVSGLLANGGKALVLAALAATTRNLIAYIGAESELDSLAEEAQFFFNLIRDPQSLPVGQAGAIGDRRSIISVPALDVDPYRGVSPHPAALEARAQALYQLSRGEVRVALIPLKSLLMRTTPPSAIKQLGREFEVGKDYDFEELMALLPRVGYRQEDPVTTVGEFSVRGGVLDVFSPAHPRPLRLEFFGDMIESIREFDPDTQRSVGRWNRAVLAPMSEIAFEPEALRQWAEAAASRWVDPIFRRDLQAKRPLAEAGEAVQGWEFQVPLVRPHQGTLFDYLSDAVLILDEPTLLGAEIQKCLDRMQAQYEEACEAGEVALSPEAFFLAPDQVSQQVSAFRRIELSSLGRATMIHDAGLEFDAAHRPSAIGHRLSDIWGLQAGVEEIALPASPMRRFHGQIPQVIDQINKAQREQMPVWMVTRSTGMAERLVEMLREYGVAVESWSDSTLSPDAPSSSGIQPVRVVVGKLSKGFVLPWAQLCVLAESDLFQEDHAEAISRQPVGGRMKMSAFLSDFRDLKPGDYVVHIDHGIGQFQKLAQLEADGAGTREFLLLQYADDAKLYVPVERLDLVQKYSSADTATPALDRLGGTSWERTKARARRALRDMADELLGLYAERRLVKGFAFSPDSSWQAEFEAGFEYELTPDQDTTIAEIKRDMEQPTPMDRLLCGDVGFGKTEVAMRAAFKAVMDGKQVAVLAPTTVLSYQHLQTFQRRFAAFPVKVELLSRFRSSKQQKQIISQLADGAIDILIGTHRLLSKDIQFRDLGLVVVDEEQRFGVAHKERLKHLRRRVDVLTLSATPIPRTLSMSLMGLKPMSVIETPPSDRLAIQTIFAPFSQGVIKTAIERELERDGQVFFIHNRIDSIYAIAELIHRLAPPARIGVTHADMSSSQLETVMMKFIRHELDILISTTVIENGIDIPLANTIIINHAERFGLGELYQLRGRVGRSNRRAYAYLLIPSESSLTPIARRRLAAIKEFSDLGAGFRLAAMDLELRGAGNLLGGEQSGHIRAIGFDLYCQMLERAIRQRNGEVIEEEVNTQIDLNVNIRIPEEYVPDMGQRLRLYKRLSSALDERRLQDIRDELLDRYGPIPDSVENLMEYMRLRREVVVQRVLSISRQRAVVHVKFDPQARVDIEKIIAFVNEATQASFSPQGVLSFKPAASGGRELLVELKTCLMKLQ